MAYQVRSRRQVPLFIESTGLITGETFHEVPVHAGEHAVFVKLDTGFMAWGFGSEPDIAEVRAVQAAMALQ